MRCLYKIAAVFLSVWTAGAGDVALHVHITKRLTKKTVAPALYDLRGTAPALTTEPELLSEFDRTVVMLTGAKPARIDPRNITIEQRNGQFEPDLAVVPVGSTVQFPNSDPIFHNVFSLSHAKQFDLGFYPKGKSKSVTFDHPGVVQVYCHIHANMYAAIVVSDSPWYGKPAADGTITWKDVPAGKYKAAAWHKIAGLYQLPIDVPATGRIQVDLYVPLDAEHRP